MAEKSIIKFNKNSTVFGDVTDKLHATSFESNKPTQHGHNYYENETLGLYIGVCNSTDNTKTAAPFAHDEFITIVEGELKIKNNKTGKVENVKAGDSCVIPHGYDCEWHQQGVLRKLYVIYKPPEIPEKAVTENVVYIDENSDIPWKETSDGHRKKTLYQNVSQRFTSGVWQSKAFTTGLINFPYHEFIYINKGSLICTDAMGIAHSFTSGDALFIPQGTLCSWEVEDKVSIHFAQISSPK
jgi:uncharacterized cupin superfamily protein